MAVLLKWPRNLPVVTAAAPNLYIGPDGSSRASDFSVVQHFGEGVSANEDRMQWRLDNPKPAGTWDIDDFRLIVDYRGSNRYSQTPYFKIGNYNGNHFNQTQDLYHTCFGVFTTQAEALAHLNAVKDVSARFRVKDNDNDVNTGAGARSELAGFNDAQPVAGVTYWLCADVLVPDGFDASNWSVAWQVHGSNQGSSPPLACDVDNGGLFIVVRNASGSEVAKPLVSRGPARGIWYAFLAECAWSTNAAIGFNKVYVATASPGTGSGGGGGGGTTVPATKTGLTFGQTAAGTAWTLASPHAKRGTKFQTDEEGTLVVDSLSVYLRGSGNQADQSVTPHLYNVDVNDNPTTLLGSFTPQTFVGSEAARFVSFTPAAPIEFTGPKKLAIVLHTGEGDAIDYSHFAVTGALKFDAAGGDLYTDGPASPWTGYSTADKQLSASLTVSRKASTGVAMSALARVGARLEGDLEVTVVGNVIPPSQVVTVNVPITIQGFERKHYRKDPVTGEPDYTAEVVYSRTSAGYIPAE